MVEFTSDKMIILLTVVFPLLFVAAALILGAGVCLIIPLFIWIGIAMMVFYLPTAREE
jgi:uncharacterized membrane protein